MATIESSNLNILFERSPANGVRPSPPSDFHDSFGELQLKLRNAKSAGLRLDFSKVEWVDPMPILVLILELAHRVKAQNLSEVEIDFGEPGTGDHNKKQARTRKFLATHRYVNCIADAMGKNVILKYTNYGDANYYRGDNTDQINILVRDMSRTKDVVLA